MGSWKGQWGWGGGEGGGYVGRGYGGGGGEDDKLQQGSYAVVNVSHSLCRDADSQRNGGGRFIRG